VVLLLVIHFVLGFRSLRESRFYADDPLVKRVLGLKRLPDVATLSRSLTTADVASVEALQGLVGGLVLERVTDQTLPTITLDFDGSVLGTGRRAEGTAVGFNRKKKGQRSYYPLFCTVAQTGQVLDVLHRSGNVHDANGAKDFIRRCVERVRQCLPDARIETRMDAAFFSEEIVSLLDTLKVFYTISVPFARLPVLKERIEQRQRWRRIDDDLGCFDWHGKPKSWQHRHRFVFLRNRVLIQDKAPVQLDIFTPYEVGHDFKVIVTNLTEEAGVVQAFHNGRGSQEGIFAELKSDNALAYVATNTWLGNQVYLNAALLAHNLTRELQMRTATVMRLPTEKRASLWGFSTMATLRRELIQRAGSLIRPQGKLTLSMSQNPAVRERMLQMFEALDLAG
jgi:hypothetical protein